MGVERSGAPVVSLMGDRFLLVRLDSTQGRSRAGRAGIDNSGGEPLCGIELASAVSGALRRPSRSTRTAYKTSPKISANSADPPAATSTELPPNRPAEPLGAVRPSQ